MFIILSVLFSFGYGVECLAAIEITNSNLIVNDENLLQYTFTANTTEPAQLYLSYTTPNGKVSYTGISELAKQHTIHLIGLSADMDIELKVHAFNHKDNTQFALSNIFIPDENMDLLNELRKTTIKNSALEENVLLTTDRGNGKEDFAFIIDINGNVIWYETLPNSNENADCNAINYDKGYIIISDCHTITRKKLDGTEEMTYTLESDSLFKGSFFHDKAIINLDSNIVSLFAHKTVVDRSIIGGGSNVSLISDGFVEFDAKTGEILYTYSPAAEIPELSQDGATSLCNYYRPLADLSIGGKWAPVFGDTIQYYRLATEISSDFDQIYKGYYLTLSKDTLSPSGGISKVSPFNALCEIETRYISTDNQAFVLYEEDLFVNPRSFRAFPDGNYFMLTNYPDLTTTGADTLSFGDGKTTRAIKYKIEFDGYYGVFDMFWSIDEYRFPEEAYTEMGSALWLPNDHILGFSDANNTLYEINDTSQIMGEWQFSEPLKVCALVEDLYGAQPVVYISEIDTVLCNNQMESFQLVGVPEGGYFEGIPLSEDNVFYPDSVEAGIYTVTYNFGPVSASMDIEVDVCSGIESLEAMGGLDSYLFPNPVSIAQPMLKYRQAKAGELQLQIFDLNGRQIEQINLGFRPTGLSAETINLQQYKNGIYVYRIFSGDMQQYKRFVVTR